jgi:hypothetical protein
MSKTKNWIMDLEDKAWDKIASAIKDCDHEAEAQTVALKAFDELGLLGNYLEAQDIEDGVSEMWNQYCSAYA